MGAGCSTRLTLNGVVSQEYGLTTDDTSHSPTSCGTPGPTTRRTATPAADTDPDRLLHAVGVAVGDLDGDGTATDPKVDAAYLVRGPRRQDDHLSVTGCQGLGFPFLADRPSPAARFAGHDREDRHVPAMVYVRYPTA